jgi:lactoylglutathione lyase
MIETDGFAEPQGKSIQENSTRLRFNVADLEEALVALSDFGIDAEITRNDWGDTINLYDPDGNRVGIRDEISFKAQIEV